MSSDEIINMNENESSSSNFNDNERWTCEACGCHTNTEENEPDSCGLCGTNRIRGAAAGMLIYVYVILLSDVYMYV